MPFKKQGEANPFKQEDDFTPQSLNGGLHQSPTTPIVQPVPPVAGTMKIEQPTAEQMNLARETLHRSPQETNQFGSENFGEDEWPGDESFVPSTNQADMMAKMFAEGEMTATTGYKNYDFNPGDHEMVKITAARPTYAKDSDQISGITLELLDQNGEEANPHFNLLVKPNATPGQLTAIKINYGKIGHLFKELAGVDLKNPTVTIPALENADQYLIDKTISKVSVSTSVGKENDPTTGKPKIYTNYSFTA